MGTMRPLNLVFQIVVWVGGLMALGMWHYRYGEKPWVKRWWVKVGAILGFFFLLNPFVIFSDALLEEIGPASWADVYDGIVPDGYAQHTVETSISVQQNWFVGETKECSSFPLPEIEASRLGKEWGYVAASINCDDGPMHTVTVNLYGRLNQPEDRIAYWRCTREPEGFACRQTGAEGFIDSR